VQQWLGEGSEGGGAERHHKEETLSSRGKGRPGHDTVALGRSEEDTLLRPATDEGRLLDTHNCTLGFWG
jgi:hypothetical protein